MKKLFAMASMLVFLHGPVQCDAGVLAEMCNAAIYRPECILLPVIGGLVASVGAYYIMESRNAEERMKKNVPIVVGISTFATIAVALCWWYRFPVITSIDQPLGTTAVIAPNVNADMLKEMFQREGTPNTVVERLEILNDSQIERILDGTFQGCPRLNSVTCPDCVEEIGACAFRDCAKLTEVMIPGAKKIGAYAFADCSALGSVTLGDGLEYVGRGAFWNCSKLNKINSKLFFNLKSRKLPNEMERLLGKSTLILDGVAVAEPEAFAGCNLLKSIVITFNCPDCVSELEAIGNKIACIVKEACSTTGIIQKAAVVTQIAPLLLSGLDTAIGGFIAHKGTVDGLKVAFPDIVVTHNYDILAYVKKYYFQWIL